MIEPILDQPLEQEKNYELAQKSARVIAFIIDYIIFLVIFFALVSFFGSSRGLSFSLEGYPALLLFAITIFLWPISEALWGQTVGKRAMRIKVLKANYEPIGFGQAIIRFILAPLDCFFLVGLIVASSSKNNQRIGDAAANTIVVRN
ncbi:RDD family protein [Fulvivirga ligni]|uniref:RDD family protein n=1 Tax=Fulvivirga ligni TaxID=2904246 RepID=UPI001F36766B|nr:RDD family protein [Fulvivirga ligni]UII19867.1 RDD family protein [Fulvivirga ligni]